MLQLIKEFLAYTGIHPETFGRLAVGDPHLLWRLSQPGFELFEEHRDRILDFIHNYEDAKS